MSEVVKSDVVVLLAADAPERVAALLSSPALIGAPVIVCPYGPRAEAVARVAEALGAATAGVSGDRWQALADGMSVAKFSRVTPGHASSDVLLLSQEAVLTSDWRSAARGALHPSGLAVAEGGAVYSGGPVGLVAPVSEQARSADQRIALSEADVALGTEAYAHNRRSVFGAVVSPLAVPGELALFVSGALLETGVRLRPDRGAWAFADLVLQASECGFGSVTAEGWYVGSSVPVPTRPEQPGELSGRLAFYGPSSGSLPGPRIWGLLRLGFRSLRDLSLIRATLGRLGPSVDGLAVVIVSNPLEVQSDPGWKQARDRMDPADKDLLRACDGADPNGVVRAVIAWIARLTGGTGGSGPRVVASVWTRPPTEAGERLVPILLAVGAEPQRAAAGVLWGLRVEPGELVEQVPGDDRATHRFLLRACAHPNHAVSAYDIATHTLWDGPQTVREDAPWGDGGSWRGGPSSTRLYRITTATVLPVLEERNGGRALPDPAFAPEAIRALNLRLYDARLIRSLDRDALLGLRRVEEGLRVSRASTATRIGLHMLVYERENPEDVARWLDETHGLVDAAFLVWTGSGAESEPTRSFFAKLALRHHGAIVDHALDDDLAGARNRGIAEVASAGCHWALFFDPDEWLLDPRADAGALRRMAESARAGWLVQVANYTETGQPTISDSIRMSSTRPEMRMTGRVHEGFGDALKAIQARGEHPRLAYARFVLQHRGMNLGALRTAEKLARYDGLLRRELAEHPDNPGAWVSLAWHLDNDGHREMAEEALQRAALCAGSAYLPFRELAVQRLREARRYLEACVERLSPDHQYAKHAGDLLRLLVANAPDAIPMPSHGTAPDPLPPFPGRASSPPPNTGAGYDPVKGST